jgi:transcriptional regulator GlxA family with amidase domain
LPVVVLHAFFHYPTFDLIKTVDMKKLLYGTSFILVALFIAGFAVVSEKSAYKDICRNGDCDHEQKSGEEKIRVLFYLQDGVEVLDFAGPMEVFSYAGFDVSVVSKTKKPIIAQGILKILPDYSIEDAPEADVLAFFGGNSGNASNDPAVVNWVKTAKSPKYYFSVCTGAFILGKAGLLDHLTVTTFYQSTGSLQEAVPTARVLSHVRFVDNGKVITTAGVSAGIDGALHLVEKIRGKEIALQAAKYMEYDKWVPDQGLVMADKSTKN